MTCNVTNRLDAKFASLQEQGCGGLITFVSAGDPDFETSRKIACGLAPSGADIIELGMPFSDPMADGPIIRADVRSPHHCLMSW